MYAINLTLRKLRHIILVVWVFTPISALAQAWSGVCSYETYRMNSIKSILCAISATIYPIIQLLIVLATVVFLWGIIRYIASAGNEEKLKEGKNLIVYGIVGLFVIISVWGLVKLLASSFGVIGVGIPAGPDI